MGPQGLQEKLFLHVEYFRLAELGATVAGAVKDLQAMLHTGRFERFVQRFALIRRSRQHRGGSGVRSYEQMPVGSVCELSTLVRFLIDGA